MNEENEKKIFNCPVEAVLSIIGGKYKTIILYYLMDGKKRFSELQRLISKATPKMLTQQLRELEKDDVIIRTIYPVVPPKTEYSLAEYGKTLIPILLDMCAWGEEHMGNQIISNNN